MIIELLNFLHSAYITLLLIRILLSWISHDPHQPAIQLLYQVTEPILAPCRDFLAQFIRLPIDFSPILAFFLIDFIHRILVRILTVF